MKHILFVGNSFTYLNDLPAVLSEIANAAGFPMEAQKVVKGGWYLNRYADPKDEMGARLREEYPKQTWDYIVLQDQSFNPAGCPEDFYAAVRTLCEMMRCRENFTFYQTWAYADGSETLRSTGLSYNQMHEKLRDAYCRAAKEHGALLAPVGDAFRLCHERFAELALLGEDDAHPSPCGTYLAACVFYAVFSGESPLNLTIPKEMAASGAVRPEDAAVLRRIAHEVMGAK